MYIFDINLSYSVFRQSLLDEIEWHFCRQHWPNKHQIKQKHKYDENDWISEGADDRLASISRGNVQKSINHEPQCDEHNQYQTRHESNLQMIPLLVVEFKVSRFVVQFRFYSLNEIVLGRNMNENNRFPPEIIIKCLKREIHRTLHNKRWSECKISPSSSRNRVSNQWSTNCLEGRTHWRWVLLLVAITVKCNTWCSTKSGSHLQGEAKTLSFWAANTAIDRK